jgi:glycine C-acetyltransferase
VVQFDSHIAQRLAALEAAGLRRRTREISGPQGTHLSIEGRSVLSLSSNNYLGLAGHPDLMRVGAEALAAYGAGSGASRLVSGTMSVHREAEKTLAAFAGFPESVLFSSGYACNLGVVQALVGRGDVVFSDSLNHASLIDGARLSRADVVVYQHADAAHLRRQLMGHRARGRAALVLTESLFSMDGDIAPLAALANLAREFQAGLLVDDAHAIGVYGIRGRGLCAEHGVTPDVLVGALGKACGIQGAFAATSLPTAELIRNRARSYVFSTAPSPALAALATSAAALVQAADAARASVLRHARTLRNGLTGLGYSVLPGTSPIIPVMTGEPEPTMALASRLLERGIFAHGIRPPTVPVGQGRLRIVPMATHTDEDIEFALTAFSEVR